MKYINIKVIFAFVALLSMASCNDKLEELYQDPNGFSKEQADASGSSVIAGFFTSQLTRGMFMRGDYGYQYHINRSGVRIMGMGAMLYYTTADYGMSYSLREVDGSDWGLGGFNYSVFNQINGDWIKQVLWAQNEYNTMAEADRTDLDHLYMKLLHVLKAYGYQRALDLYEEVPYIETGSAGGLTGEEIVYLTQEDLYPILLDELKEASSYIKDLDIEASQLSVFAAQDVVFDGDLDLWEKYINSLRLRIAMTVSEMLPSTTSEVLAELASLPLLEEYDDVAGIADVDIVELYRIRGELGITRAFDEMGGDSRAPQKFVGEVMHCTPVEKSAVVNGETLYYYESDNSASGLEDGTVDPRLAYMFSSNINGDYIGAEIAWDNSTDQNSHFSKLCRGYYINHPILTDLSVIEIELVPDQLTITLDSISQTDLALREAFLLKQVKYNVAQYNDTDWSPGTDKNMVAEYNVRPWYNFAMIYPTIQSVETELFLAEAAVRGFGTIKGSAEDHYKKAIELSCKWWYQMNIENSYSKNTTPSFPTTFDDSRVTRDMPSKEYDAAAYAEYEGNRFSQLTDQEKVQAIYNQLQVHYNFFNFEICYTTARRLIKYLGDNPTEVYEVYKWKERMLYPSGISASDPDNWSKISSHDNADMPVWFTGRTEKWRNVLE